MSSESDSEEFFDATEDVGAPSPGRKSKESLVKESKAPPVVDAYELEIQRLEEERLKAAENRREEDEKRKREDEEIQRKLIQLAEKKKEEEKKLIEEQRMRVAEDERRHKEEEERKKQKQEAEKRRIEAEKRRKRLEERRRKEESGLDEDSEKETNQPDPSDAPVPQEPSDKDADEERHEAIPDLVASTTGRPMALPLDSESKEMPPPAAKPVAPPRRKKKKVSKLQQQKAAEGVEVEGESTGLVEDMPVVGLPLDIGSGSRPGSGILTPTTTIANITKELEHSLDLESASRGNSYVKHHDSSTYETSVPHSDQDPPERLSSDILGDMPPECANAPSGLPPESPMDHWEEAKSRSSTPEMEKLLKYHLLMQGQSQTGVLLTDDEVLSQVMVKNLDTGEQVSLLQAEDKLPACVNPLSLHIMRLTSEYVSNGSLDKMDASDSEQKKEDSPVAQLKLKSNRLKKFTKKMVQKAKTVAGDAFKHEEQASSDDESLPDTKSVKFRVSSSHKGPYDFDQLKLAQELGSDTGAIWTMKFSLCGRLLATAGQNHLLKVWVLKNHEQYFGDMRQKYNTETRASPTPSQESILDAIEKESVSSSGGGDGNDEEDSDQLAVFAKAPFCVYTGHTADVLDVSWSKNYFMLSSSMDKTVRLWHISRSECLCCFQHIDFVTAIAFHPRDDRYFLSGSLDGKLRLWNIPDKKVALWNEIDGQTKLITAANFIQNGRFSVVGTYDGRCIFYDTEHLKYYCQVHVRSTRGRNAKGRKITGIEPLPGEDKILVTSNDSRLRVYDLRDLSISCKYRGCSNYSSQIKASFSHNRKYIVCGSEDFNVYFWKTNYDFGKFSSVRRDRNDYWEAIKAHNAVVTTAVFSPNPSLVITPIAEGTSDVTEKREGSPGSPSVPLKRPDKIDTKGEGSSRGGSLKKDKMDKGELLVSADFNGQIKVFINYPKIPAKISVT
ncbi:WD repeat-containing protein 44-like [Anneissia japonica]|uniref:WD repeat-containing protein 44-like n=1 Tax=Anneissia japonica TaxID=1529436 RepID=UPI001425A1EE|nr:WD repeat-containing protein 44-like [Anneissia japonica]